ncbi:MAG: lytic transglycosylase domain-containing protein [Candidatus Acidiferrales bacterium]
MDIPNTQYVAPARAAAMRHGLPPELVCAVCEQESAWCPFAIRYEPAFFSKYVAPLFTNNEITATEAYARGISWGLMQVMGQVAREFGFARIFLSELCDPATGLDIGSKILAHKVSVAQGNLRDALLAWNGGGNPDYPAQVLARMSKYT